jgi:hypothetical protein
VPQNDWLRACGRFLQNRTQNLGGFSIAAGSVSDVSVPLPVDKINRFCLTIGVTWPHFAYQT